MNPLGLLTGKVALYVCGLLLAALAALGLAYWVQSVQLDACQVETDRQKVAVERLAAAIKDQNDAVAKLRDVAGEKAAAAHEALASARAANSKYEASRKRLAALLASPSPSGAGCREAAEAVRAELRK